MLDIKFRPLKDNLFDPICKFIPPNISPTQITAVAFFSGVSACVAASTSLSTISTIFWLLNRILDCLDGALARHRKQASDLGGFLDLLGDFIVYSMIPIACGVSVAAQKGNIYHLWLSIATVEASFHINNFVLFYVAAIIEKRKGIARDNGTKEQEKVIKELTSVAMRPALIEGTESGVIFTLMLYKPDWTEALCWGMAGLVSIGIIQRATWIASALR